jgi:hypothetical protein
LHEHRDRRPNAVIHEDHESLFLVAKKNGEAAAGRSYGTDVHFDNGLTHTAISIRLSRQDPNYRPHRWRPNDCFRVLEQPDVSSYLRLVSWRPLITNGKNKSINGLAGNANNRDLVDHV